MASTHDGGSASSDRDRQDPEAVFLEQLPYLEDLVASCCRRSGFGPEEAEDFRSWVRIRLLEDDYAVLRKFRGESKITTYLSVVVNHLLLDYRARLWGKFRPSAKARRLGQAAVELERLLYHDRMDLRQAIDRLCNELEYDFSEEEVRELAGQLPRRERRTIVGEQALEQLEGSDRVGRRLDDEERERTQTKVSEVLTVALDALSAQDVLILKMNFGDGMSLADVASALRLEQRPLYRRRRRCLRALRDALEEERLEWSEVRELLGWDQLALDSGLGREETD
jgi:RNA polymerase sigma factor for flagellar operon FliA